MTPSRLGLLGAPIDTRLNHQSHYLVFMSFFLNAFCKHPIQKAPRGSPKSSGALITQENIKRGKYEYQ